MRESITTDVRTWTTPIASAPAGIGEPLRGTFTEAHILAVTQAICDYRRGKGIDCGFEYNPPHSGPADTATTRWIEERANEYLLRDDAGMKRIAFDRAIRAETTRQEDLVLAYVNISRNVVDMQVIRGANPVWVWNRRVRTTRTA